MNAPDSDRIAVTFTLTADDYARYSSAVGRRRRSWTPSVILGAVLFCAIPVALLFRFLAAHRFDDAAAIETVGLDCLLAFALGFFAAMIGLSIIERMRNRSYFAEVVDPGDARTVALERTGLTLTGKTSESRLQWGTVKRCTRERDLILLWIAPLAAVVIPCRSVGDARACDRVQAFIHARLAEAKAAAASATGAPPLT